jgi:hypothetical protein
MAEFLKDVDTQLELTTYTLNGVLDKETIENIIRDFYSQTPTQLVLWDVTGCPRLDVTASELGNISKLILKTRVNRPTGKTAFVINENDVGVGLLFENLARMENLPYEYRTFDNMPAARKWLGLAA